MNITNTRIYGLEESIIASGYPMLDKPLSEEDFEKQVLYVVESMLPETELFTQFEVDCAEKGNKHIKRAIKLAQVPNGSGHDNYLKGIIVQMDVNAPQYFWQQLQRYNFIFFISSMSKMHCLTKFDKDMINIGTTNTAIMNMEYAIKAYSEGQINVDEMLMNVPMGLEYTARLTTNYLQLKTVYKQRRQHRSKQWQVFCDWIETLPMAQELIIGKTFKNELYYKENK